MSLPSVFATRYWILMMAMEPAKMPRLIATATPNFSRLFIWSFQRITHGSKARIKSVAAEYEPMNRDRSSNALADQQLEGILGFQRWRGSSQRAKTKMEISMCKMFMEMMMNQSNTMTQCCAATRINVRAKLVFPKAHDMMTSGCDTKLSSATSIASSGFWATYSRCRPNPLSAATVRTAAYAIKRITAATMKESSTPNTLLRHIRV
uniref:Uncharacterized protein n=1 Tax=Photinus pyralis TaxID=7054 RepID=A0A1Y1M7U1_PHOPY